MSTHDDTEALVEEALDKWREVVPEKRDFIRTILRDLIQKARTVGWMEAAEHLDDVPPQQSPQQKYHEWILAADGDVDEIARALLGYRGFVERGCAAFLRREAERRKGKG